MTGPHDPRISVYRDALEPDMWHWTVTNSPGAVVKFGQQGSKPTEAAAWRQAENVLLVCDQPMKAAA
jgi:hypothetical protein